MAKSEVIQVIRTKSCKGKGTDDNLMRTVTEYFTLEGERICEDDPCSQEAMPGVVELHCRKCRRSVIEREGNDTIVRAFVECFECHDSKK
jgi:hypothetical protein